MSNKIDLVYLLIDHGFTLDVSPVLQSQIIDKIQLQESVDINIAVIASVKNVSSFDTSHKRNFFFNNVRTYFFDDKGILHNLLQGFYCLYKLRRDFGIRWIYARSIWSALLFRFYSNIYSSRMIYDFRGDLLSESAATGSSRVKLLLLRKFQSMAFSISSEILTVSHASIPFLKKNYNIKTPFVMPSAVKMQPYIDASTDSNKFRNYLGIQDDEIVLIYAGGMAHYQMIPQMLVLWKKLSEKFGVRCIFLTNNIANIDSASSLLLGSIPDLICCSVSRENVPSYLAAADIGFLLRERHELNSVASPVKFAEYLASGLAIVTSPGLGDVSGFVEEKDLGVLVDPNNIVESVSSCSDMILKMHDDRLFYNNKAKESLVESSWDMNTHAIIWKKILFSSEINN